ncbi:MAG: hypothetical protein ACPGLV_12290, partial [Bacteroidia bacterium]
MFFYSKSFFLRLSLIATLVFEANLLLAQNFKEQAQKFVNTYSVTSQSNLDSIEYYILQNIENEDVAQKQVKYIMALGVLNVRKPNYIEALRWFSRLENGGYPLTQKDSIDLFSQTRTIFIRIKSFGQALESHLKLKKYAKNYTSDYDILNYNSATANIFLGLKSYGRAIESYRSCARLSRKTGNYQGLAMYYNDIGLCYERSFAPDSAIFYLNKGISVLENNLKDKPYQIVDSFTLILIKGNIAQVRFKQKSEFDGVEKDLKNDLRFSRKNGDYENCILTLNHMSQYYFDVGDYNKSVLAANRSIFSAKKFDIKVHTIASNQIKAKAFKKLGVFDSAMICLQRSISSTDSLSLAKSDIQRSTLEVVFALDQKEERLQEQIKINKLANSKLNETLSKNQKIFTVLVILALSLIFLYYAY